MQKSGCACATRALELFVRDFAGLRIQGARRRGFGCGRGRVVGAEQRGLMGGGQGRGLAVSAGMGRPEAATARAAEDGRASGEESVQGEEGGGGAGEGARDVQDGGLGGRNGRLDDLGTARAIEKDASIGAEPGMDRETKADKAAEDIAQTTDSPRADAAAASNPLDAPAASPSADTPIPPTSNSTDASASAPTPQQARVQGRLQRKHRRLAAGKYRPTANGRVDEDTPADPEAQEPDSRTSVLGMIESMEGPKIAKRQPGKPNPRNEDYKTKDKPAKDRTREKAELAPRHKKEQWQIQKAALSAKFSNAAWNPNKRLSPDTLSGIRSLHATDSATYSTAVLAEQFEVSPENIRRILRSKWRPREEEEVERRERWERRGVRKWEGLVQKGVKPPKKWRELGVGSLKGSPEEKPVWKKGARGRGREEFDVRGVRGAERGFGDRLL